MLDDIVKEVLRGVLFDFIFDTEYKGKPQRARAEKALSRADRITAGCLCGSYVVGLSLVIVLPLLMLPRPLYFEPLWECWTLWLLVLHAPIEIAASLRRQLTPPTRQRLRALLHVRYCLRPKAVTAMRWLPVVNAAAYAISALCGVFP